ncbi:MAG: MoaD/ThiS family protein [Desulfurellaceae bacterium]|nr:MoaD/ThiS family protein [Desulfurellaceae bacterium]
MEVKLRLFATLRKKLPPGSKAGKAVLTLDQDATIRDVIQQLDIPEDLAQMVLVNGEQTRAFDQVLTDGDSLSIFPPVAGGSGEDLTRELTQEPAPKRTSRPTRSPSRENV